MAHVPKQQDLGYYWILVVGFKFDNNFLILESSIEITQQTGTITFLSR